jgi:uncharacterized protein YukE
MAPSDKSGDAVAIQLAGAQFRETFKDISTETHKLSTNLANVKWQSGSRSAFDDMYKNWKASFDQLYYDLETMADALQGTSTNQLDTEEKNKIEAKFF